MILADEPPAALQHDRGRAVTGLPAADADGWNAAVVVCRYDERGLDPTARPPCAPTPIRNGAIVGHGNTVASTTA